MPPAPAVMQQDAHHVRPRPLERAAGVEVLEQVALVRLVPADPAGRDAARGSDVRAAARRAGADAAPRSRVMARDHQRRAERARASSGTATGTTLANGNRNSRLASGCSGESQRTIVGSRYVAPVPAARGAAPPRWRRGHVARARHLPARGRSAPRCARPRPGRRTARAAACGSSSARGPTRGQPLAPAPRRSRAACAGAQTPDALTQERPPFSAIDATITSRYCSQSSAASGPEQHLAVAGAVHLDARVAVPRASSEPTSPNTMPRPQRRRISPRAGVVGRVVAERLGRRARLHEGLDRCGTASTARRCPASARAASSGRSPAPTASARRASCSAARRRASAPRGTKLSAWPCDSPMPAVEHAEVEAAREAGEHASRMSASTPRIFSMLRRTSTWGRPVVAESWRT